jgi:hypothetical protein
MTRTVLIQTDTCQERSADTQKWNCAIWHDASDIGFSGWRCEVRIGVLHLQQKFVGRTEDMALLLQMRQHESPLKYVNRTAGYSIVGLLNFYE